MAICGRESSECMFGPAISVGKMVFLSPVYQDDIRQSQADQS